MGLPGNGRWSDATGRSTNDASARIASKVVKTKPARIPGEGARNVTEQGLTVRITKTAKTTVKEVLESGDLRRGARAFYRANPRPKN